MSADFWRELKKILPDLPDRTRSLVIRMSVNEPVVVECEFYPDIEGLVEDIQMKTFRLEEENEPDTGR